MAKETIGKTLTVALLLCIVCSVIVSGAAVSLKPLQQANKDNDRKRNILLAAGLYQPGLGVDEQFSAIQTRLVDLSSGKFVEGDVNSFDQRKAAKDPATSARLDAQDDIAKISRRENHALVYIVEENGVLDKVILPVHGYGLWSTLYGFIALESDLNTVAGLGFYDHGETPGLGGEVDNPRWKAVWPGKKIYDDTSWSGSTGSSSDGSSGATWVKDGSKAVALKLIKGAVNPNAPGAAYQVDGLAGATLTSRGVTNLVQFWLGENGFRPFLENFSRGDA